jgi:hypothetical protein
MMSPYRNNDHHQSQAVKNIGRQRLCLAFEFVSRVVAAAGRNVCDASLPLAVQMFMPSNLPRA